ncbi:hypothetical protein [Levilactobacillus parabrevis]|uniref:hypothetical protein n=1 Tax=Levilactobacillus parabrevis TaxID=357278 RepID=UPI000AD7FF9F|nr:hypothetical protein [Levilactobacillus parabrevis]
MRLRACLKLGLTVMAFGLVSLGAGVTAQAKTKNVIDHKDCVATNKIFKAQGFELSVLRVPKNGEIYVAAFTKKQAGKRYEFVAGEQPAGNAVKVNMIVYQGKKVVSRKSSLWGHVGGKYYKDLVSQNNQNETYMIASKTKTWSLKILPPHNKVVTATAQQLMGSAAMRADIAFNRNSLEYHADLAANQGKNLLVLNQQDDKAYWQGKKILKKYKAYANYSKKTKKMYQRLQRNVAYLENIS